MFEDQWNQLQENLNKQSTLAELEKLGVFSFIHNSTPKENLDLFFGVISRHEERDLRNFIRQTWGNSSIMESNDGRKLKVLYLIISK